MKTAMGTLQVSNKQNLEINFSNLGIVRNPIPKMQTTETNQTTAIGTRRVNTGFKYYRNTIQLHTSKRERKARICIFNESRFI